MKLKFLEFDCSEDADGIGTFDAMASVQEARWAELRAEVEQVLAWAERHWGERAPLDDGGSWDVALEAVHEVLQPLAMTFEAGRGLRTGQGGAAQSRYSLTVTLCGVPGFCASLREHFGLEA